MIDPELEQRIRSEFERWNSGDHSFDPDWTDPNVEIHTAVGELGGTVYRGFEGLRQWVDDMHEAFDEWRLDLRELEEVAPHAVGFSLNYLANVPEVLDLICAHPEVDAVIHLGLGIQAAQAQAFRSGPFFPGYGIDRIAEFHERQDRRYAKAAREASERVLGTVRAGGELLPPAPHGFADMLNTFAARNLARAWAIEPA